MMRLKLLCCALFFVWLTGVPSVLFSQADSVDVTFSYKPVGTPSAVYLPGEFNGWVRNSVSRMNRDSATNTWSKTVRLRVGGPLRPQGISGAYQYKFNEDNQTWLSDPLNPRQNRLDNNNSVLYTYDPTIHYLLPNSLSGIVTDTRPLVSADIFPSVGFSVVPSSLRLFVDGVEYSNIGDGYDPATKRFAYRIPEALTNGEHSLKMVVSSSAGRTSADSTTFTVQGGFIRILNQSNRRYLKPTIRVDGLVEDTGITTGTLFHNDDPLELSISNGAFSQNVDLVEGENTFRATVTDGDGLEQESSPVTITYVVDHAPKPWIDVSIDQSDVVFSVSGNDPDGDPVTVEWHSEDERNPVPLGITATGNSVSVSAPAAPGIYHVVAEATDPGDERGVARAYFEVDGNGAVRASSLNSNPGWVRDAVVYEIFMPAFTTAGTFKAAAARLPKIKELGASVIWLMPIYENGERIDQLNAGYNITDFYQVHPQLGSMADFEEFVRQAHSLGIRVILDSTPNHVSHRHPWVEDIRLFGSHSNHRPRIETRILGDDRGLGQTIVTVDGQPLYVHYSNWPLANLNYQTVETVTSMLEMYKWWAVEEGIDGYRMDVYWGPQNRYGSSVWWRPFREEIKRVRPDIFILGETDGTGFNSEYNYADGGGACDAAYDWNLFHQFAAVLNNGSIADFDNRVRNYSPGLNYNQFSGFDAHYFRFLENHDETRVASLVGSTKSKAGAAALLTIPGIPLIYAGQEVGEISTRDRINWSRPGAEEMFAYYKRLLAIRNRFATFRSPRIKRLVSSQPRVYAYLRPELDQNALVAINFSDGPGDVRLTINEADLQLSADSLVSQKTYYLNDVLNDTVYTVTRSTLGSFSTHLSPWEAAVFVFADTLMQITTEVVESPDGATPRRFVLEQNYPNPFSALNGSIAGAASGTSLRYTLAEASSVVLEVYNLRGRRVATLVRRKQAAGDHEVHWNGRDDRGRDLSAGMYIATLRAGDVVRNVRMVLLR